jgi:hypothetical protein
LNWNPRADYVDVDSRATDSDGKAHERGKTPFVYDKISKLEILKQKVWNLKFQKYAKWKSEIWKLKFSKLRTEKLKIRKLEN